MADCCDPRGCDWFFGPRFARRVARSYRRHGLDKTARRMVAFLEQQGIEGATVLEIGGGIGEIQIELLKRGAVHTLNLELSPAYESEALKLLDEAGLQDRAERRLHDIAVDPAGVPMADVVILHRVVCCYPDHERLLSAAADRAGRLLVFSYPRYQLIPRLVLAAQNVAFRLLRSEFRVFARPPEVMLGVLAEHGLRTTYQHHAPVWQVAGLQR